LDDVLALTPSGGEKLAEAHAPAGTDAILLVGLLRQSVFGRLVGYEGVNDAERLCHDPAMRWVVGGGAPMGRAASASQMGRFETERLAQPENLAALADLSGQWIEGVHQRRRLRVIVLDMDSSESPTYGEQEGSAYNGHFGCTCYHPLFVFNQFGDLERCALWSGNVHSVAGWRPVLEPVIARYRGRVKGLYFRGNAAFANPEVYEFLETEGMGYASICRPTGSCRTRSATSSSVRSVDRRRRCAGTIPASATRQAATSGGQGRVAPRRALSARRLHRH
jgi:Transposase DDE domain group 1